MLVTVEPVERLEGAVLAPPSKNYTSRYIWLAALTEGESEIVRPALNDDARALIAACRQLGAVIREEPGRLFIRGFGSSPKSVATLDPGNGGLVLRLLLALGVWLPDTVYRTDYMASLGKRPHGDLLSALDVLGVRVESEEGRLPIRLRGQGGNGGVEVKVSGAVSSQFATALLLVGPLFSKGLTVKITNGLRSKPPLRTTLEVMAQAGVEVVADWQNLCFTVPPNQRYHPRIHYVPGDYPAASAILAAASILPSRVEVGELYEDAQGERAVVEGLIRMGADLRISENQVVILGGRPLHGIEFDGDEATDGVLALSAAAAYANGTTRFYGVGNLRYKESDRIGDYGRELRKLGIVFEEEADAFRIVGQPSYQGAVIIDAHHDHRIIMAATIIALRTRHGLKIQGAEHVSKSFPDFFDVMRALGARIAWSNELS